MRVRWRGTVARDLAVSSGFLHFPPGEWVDVEAAATAALIPVAHAVIAARSVTAQPDWELETTKPTKKDST